ncbi:MAG: polysaccharide export protein [Candidatus Marinimicrobia bacterium]|nr:polysaccharide export protein [Candidatus Neomarinimicrobiota bacterium]
MQRNGFRCVAAAALVLALALGSGCGLLRGRRDGSTYTVAQRQEVAAQRLPSLVAGEGGSRLSSSPDLSPASSIANRLRPADPLMIYLRGIPREQTIETVVDDRGMVQIPLLGSIRAAGRTASELEREIREQYISGAFYRDLTVTVLQPSRFYFIQGEIRQPGRFPLVSGVTILQAVAAAGGYTEFANPRRITVARGDETFSVNLTDIERNPEKDFELESGDVVRVPRSIF